jgi:predicted flap endonuclease-1-like 5' DNA nuclease
MSYLLTQMFLYMLCAFLLGLLLGWLIWRYGKRSSADYDALLAERDALKTERRDLQTNLDACRTRGTADRETIEALRADKIDMQAKLDAAGAQRQAVPAPAPVAAAPTINKAASKPEGLSAPRGGKADDLKQISGVGPTMEKLLHSLGYFHFDQIAAWTPAEVAWVDDNLEGFKGRATRDEWIRQAKQLARS